MIRCPKCGFEQPPDVYCARCGVNMETYKAPPVPMSRKLAGSGGFNIFLIATVIVATAYFIYNRRINSPTNTIELQTQYTQENQPKISSPPSTSEADETLAQRKARELKNAATALFRKSPTTTGLPHPTKTLKTEESPAAEAAPLPSTPQMTVHYLEVSQSQLPILFAGASDGGTTGTLPDFAARLAEAKKSGNPQAIKSLARAEKKIEGPMPMMFSQELAEGRGLFIRVVALPAGGDGTLNLEVQIENRGQTPAAPGAALTILDLEDSFAISNKMAAYFLDPLTRSPVRPEDEPLFARHAIYRVLLSPEFQSNLSNFFIFLEVNGIAPRAP